MPEQDVKAGELNKAKEIFDVVLPLGDKAGGSGASKRRAVPLSTADDSDVACLRPEFDFGPVGRARSIRCGIRQRVFGRARQSHRICRRRGGRAIRRGNPSKTTFGQRASAQDWGSYMGWHSFRNSYRAWLEAIGTSTGVWKDLMMNVLAERWLNRCAWPIAQSSRW